MGPDEAVTPGPNQPAILTLIIGTIELIGVLAEQARIVSGPLADIANIPLDDAGYGIVALFFISWIAAVLMWRYGHIEEKWSSDLRASVAEIP